MKQHDLSIEEILVKVTASRVFGSSERQLKLLEYLLSEKHANREKQIKGYNIAIEVLGRPKDFDNNSDSIVRVEMHRLRKNLTLFNASSDTLNLTIPKASYVVDIVVPTSARSKEKRKAFLPIQASLGLTAMLLSAALIYKFVPLKKITLPVSYLCSQEIPNLRLIPTKMIGDTQLGKEVSLTIDNHLQTGMIQYPSINTITGEAYCATAKPPLYNLKSEVFITAENTFISIIIEHVDTRQIIFSEKIDVENPERILTDSTSIALYKIASKTAHLSGTIPHDAIQRPWIASINKRAYECQVKASKILTASYTSTAYKEAVKCMEAAIKSGSTSPDLHALLAFFYVDQARGYHPLYTDFPMKKAEGLLIRAEMIAPLNPRVLASRVRLESEREHINIEELQFFIYALERQQPFNPHTLTLTSQVAGYKIGDWAFAKKITDRAKKLDRTGSSTVYYVDAAYDFLFSDPQDAYLTTQKVYISGSTISLILTLAIANKAGDTKKLEEYKQELAELGLPNNAAYIAFVKKRQYEPVLTKELIKWLSATK